MRSGGRSVHVRQAMPRPASVNIWGWHRSLGHLRVLSITFLLTSIWIVLERSDLGSHQINVGHCTWPGGASTKSLRFEAVWVKVSVEVIHFFSLASSEEEENDNYEDEDTDGTSDNATGDGPNV